MSSSGGYGQEPRAGFTKRLWRVALEARGLGAVSINVRITAVRKLAVEAADNGLLEPKIAAGRQRRGAPSGTERRNISSRFRDVRAEEGMWDHSGGNRGRDRFRAAEGASPDSWVFPQKRTAEKPLWDSGVRDALHQAAQLYGA